MDGQTIKLSVPVKAFEVVKHYPNHGLAREPLLSSATETAQDEQKKGWRVERLMLLRQLVSGRLRTRRQPQDETRGGAVRMRVGLPRGEVKTLMEESKDNREAGEKIARLWLDSQGMGGFD